MHMRHAKAQAVIGTAHRSGVLFTKVRAALDEAIAAQRWGAVQVWAEMCELLKPPVIDHEQDVTELCKNYVMRSYALAVLGHEGA